MGLGFGVLGGLNFNPPPPPKREGAFQRQEAG